MFVTGPFCRCAGFTRGGASGKMGPVRAITPGASLLLSGCLLPNPDFNGGTSGASGGATVTGGTSGGTSGATTGGTSVGATTSVVTEGLSATEGSTAATGGESSSGGGSSGGASSGGSSTGGGPEDQAKIECPEHPNLTACYPFPAGADKLLVDGAGSGIHGTMTAVVLEDGPPGHSKAVRVLEASEITVGDHIAFRPAHFTVSALVYPLEGGYVVDHDNHFGLQIGGGSVSCQVVNDEGEFPTASAQIPVKQWSQVSCSFDGAKVRVSVRSDGAMDDGYVSLGGALNPDPGPGVMIGMNGPQFDMRLSGLIDQVLFFDAALSADELCAFHPFC